MVPAHYYGTFSHYGSEAWKLSPDRQNIWSQIDETSEKL